ncbi:MAG: hypothetical protein HYV90_03445 [Candidatus Woesebacteria bacterium]|nr:MAG: hypothetical protein HYV90_03445 [Candidatus Woesebacteria bacterium]
MSSTLERLTSRVRGATEPTPRAVDDAIHPKITDINVLIQNLPQELMDEFISNTGRSKKDKFRKFKRQLSLLVEDYKPTDLLKMSAECIKNDGGIDIQKLEEILDEEKDFVGTVLHSC